MQLHLLHDSPVPLYHQIVEALRYRIATGSLAPDAALPPIREAADDWGVHMHTVRRAYGELAQQGLVRSRPSLGTRVVGPVSRAGDGALGEFLAGIAQRAREEHGLSTVELAGMLEELERESAPRARSVHVLECNTIQCTRHAAEIRAHWDVAAKPWSLEQAGEPPRGALVATYFHYNEVRRRWPRRLGEVYFATIRADPALRKQVASRAGARIRRLILCELDEPIALNIAADLSSVFPEERFTIEPRVVRKPARLLAGRGRTPVLFSPRTWSALNDTERAHPRAYEVRYVFPHDELEALGRHFRWRRVGVDHGRIERTETRA